MADFFTADWHLGEERFKLMARPFTTTREHNDYIIARHNELVGPDDTVHVVGDVISKLHPEFLPDVGKMNGRKTLYRGNHDAGLTDEQLAPYFAEIVPEGDGRVVCVDGLACWVTHYPTEAKSEYFNIVGHIHSSWKVQLNMLNVGVDVHHFRPVPFADVKFYLEAISKFYDKDVWVAYEEFNAKYRDERGPKTKYFKRS